MTRPSVGGDRNSSLTLRFEAKFFNTHLEVKIKLAAERGQRPRREPLSAGTPGVREAAQPMSQIHSGRQTERGGDEVRDHGCQRVAGEVSLDAEGPGCRRPFHST